MCVFMCSSLFVYERFHTSTKEEKKNPFCLFGVIYDVSNVKMSSVFNVFFGPLARERALTTEKTRKG